MSLDTLVATKFNTITLRNQFEKVVDNLHLLLNHDFQVKVNVVLMKGFNDNEITDFVNLTESLPISVRFIEFMPLDGDQNWSQADVVTEQEILSQLSSQFTVQVLEGQGANPARSYRVDGANIGIISTISNSFCGECDRLRLNAQGEFYNCLFAKQGLNLKPDIQQFAQLNQHEPFALEGKLSTYVWHKEQGFHAIQKQQLHQPVRKISMHMIGG